MRITLERGDGLVVAVWEGGRKVETPPGTYNRRTVETNRRWERWGMNLRAEAAPATYPKAP